MGQNLLAIIGRNGPARRPTAPQIREPQKIDKIDRWQDLKSDNVNNVASGNRQMIDDLWLETFHQKVIEQQFKIGQNLCPIPGRSRGTLTERTGWDS